MSSKFSRPWGVQKPPAVCRKPPVPMPFPPPPWYQNELQGMLAWLCPNGSPALDFSGAVTLIPEPAHNQLTGSVTGDQYDMELIIEYFPPAYDLEITINLLEAGLLIDSYTINVDEPQSEDPFDSGLLHFLDGVPGCTITARAWV